jgi:hypothetical protein
MLSWVVTFYDNSTGPCSTAQLLSLPPSTAISNRKSGIRNPNNRRIFNLFHFSNRKYSQLFPVNLVFSPAMPSPRRPRLARHSSPITRHCLSNREITLTISTTSNFKIETK